MTERYVQFLVNQIIGRNKPGHAAPKEISGESAVHLIRRNGKLDTRVVIRSADVRSIGEYADRTLCILPEELALRSPCAAIINPADIVLTVVITGTVINKQSEITARISAIRQICFGYQTAYRSINPYYSVSRKIFADRINVFFAGSQQQCGGYGRRQDRIPCKFHEGYHCSVPSSKSRTTKVRNHFRIYKLSIGKLTFPEISVQVIQNLNDSPADTYPVS